MAQVSLLGSVKEPPRSYQKTHELVIENPRIPQEIQKRSFVHNSVCSQVWESLFAILCEVICIQTQEEIHHFSGWEGGRGAQKL